MFEYTVKHVLNGHCYVRAPVFYGHFATLLCGILTVSTGPLLIGHLPNLVRFCRGPLKTGLTVLTNITVLTFFYFLDYNILNHI